MSHRGHRHSKRERKQRRIAKATAVKLIGTSKAPRLDDEVIEFVCSALTSPLTIGGAIGGVSHAMADGIKAKYTKLCESLDATERADAVHLGFLSRLFQRQLTAVGAKQFEEARTSISRPTALLFAAYTTIWEGASASQRSSAEACQVMQSLVLPLALLYQKSTPDKANPYVSLTEASLRMTKQSMPGSLASDDCQFTVSLVCFLLYSASGRANPPARGRRGPSESLKTSMWLGSRRFAVHLTCPPRNAIHSHGHTIPTDEPK